MSTHYQILFINTWNWDNQEQKEKMIEIVNQSGFIVMGGSEIRDMIIVEADRNWPPATVEILKKNGFYFDFAWVYEPIDEKMNSLTHYE